MVWLFPLENPLDGLWLLDVNCHGRYLMINNSADWGKMKSGGGVWIVSLFLSYLHVPNSASRVLGGHWGHLEPDWTWSDPLMRKRLSDESINLATSDYWAAFLFCLSLHLSTAPPPLECREDIRSETNYWVCGYWAECCCHNTDEGAVISRIDWLPDDFYWMEPWKLRKGETGWSFCPYPACWGRGLPYTIKWLE